MVLELLQSHRFFAKASKCTFGSKEVEYLGHLISKARVKVDPQKIIAMQGWLVPTNPKALRGFLVLTRYYRKFVRGYGIIVAPLTALLRKNSFVWTKKAQRAFNQLKQAMINPPVLRVPNFSKPFVVECDACGEGLGAVFM